MLLRSSSTPSLSTLLPSTNALNSPKHSTLSSPKKFPTKKLSIQQKGSTNAVARSSSCNFLNEIPPSVSNRKPISRLQRAQSVGNLASINKPRRPILRPIPASDEEDVEERLKVESRKVEDDCVSLETAYRNSKGIGNLFEMKTKSVPSEMKLAVGRRETDVSKVDRGGGQGGGYNRDGSGWSGVRDYYKKMVEENPGNPLFLINYAQFLHQSNDLRGAEENYARAILMDPSDSRTLSTYAQVIWELHHDEERASSYFERALQVAPQDGQVLAAYASILWDTQQDSKLSM